MHINGINISGQFPPLRDLNLKFDSRVNIFIGPNGVGKTTILRCLSPQMSEISGIMD